MKKIIKRPRKKKLKDFNNIPVNSSHLEELRDFLWDYLIIIQKVEMTDLPSLSLVSYRILSDGRWKRIANENQ